MSCRLFAHRTRLNPNQLLLGFSLYIGQRWDAGHTNVNLWGAHLRHPQVAPAPQQPHGHHFGTLAGTQRTRVDQALLPGMLCAHGELVAGDWADDLEYLFRVSEPTARRTVKRVLPALGAASRATFRWPDRKRGRSPPEILQDCPEAAMVIDSFEQRRPKDKKNVDKNYSGRKKQITRTTQVRVELLSNSLSPNWRKLNTVVKYSQIRSL